MTGCASEGTWLLHADDELPAGEAQRLAEHVAGCPRCAGLLAALRGENRLLARVLEQAPAASAVAAPRLLPEVLALSAGVIAIAAGLRWITGWFSALGRESPAALLDQRGLLVGLLFDAVFYLLRQGASMLDSILSVLGVLGLAVLGGLFAVSLRRGWLAKALLVALVLLPGGAASALETRTAKGERGQVLVPAGETIDDSLVAAGDTVVIEGTITGNLIAGGRRVVVRGTVEGDLVAAAERVEVEGTVEGSVFGAGDTVVIRGPVGRSAYGFAEELRIDHAGRVDGDLVGFAAEVGVDGRVGRDLVAFARTTSLRGEVGRKLTARTGTLRLEAAARVGGDLRAHVKKAADVQVSPGATIGGKTETRIAPPKKSRYASVGFYVWRLIWLGAAFVTGLLLERLLPRLFAAVRSGGGGSLLRASGVGFVILVATPAAAAVACATLVGLPLGLLALALWASGLYLAQLPAAALIGRGILQRAAPTPPSFAVALLVGLVVLSVLGNVAYFGGIVRAVATVLGLGLGALGLRRGTAAAA